MNLWRISDYVGLEGLGAEHRSGRWHTLARGKRIVYLAEHPAVALLENLANLRGDPTLFPDSFRLMKVIADREIRATDLLPDQLVSTDRQNILETQAMGDQWLASQDSALLRVPSIPSPESWNYLLNPLHPDASSVRIEWDRRVAYDMRLFHFTSD